MKTYNKQLLTEYHVDFKTHNMSFLKIASILHDEGVTNYTFFLRIDNKNLIGVDPYDPDLTEALRIQIFKECMQNRWYFFREVFRVTGPGASIESGGGFQFELNRGNLAYLWAMELNISAYLIMPRQTGKTWAAIADITWVHQFKRGSTVLHFNKNQKDANDNLQRIQDAIRMLPNYMQHSNEENLDAAEKRRVKNNEKSIRNTINATIEAMASAGNAAKADAMARGRTASKIWYDEIAFIFFNSVIFGAATPAYEKAREISMKTGNPYAISIMTTPGDLATPHGAFAYKMMENAIRFDEKMYNLKRKDLFDIINNTPDKSNFVYIQYTYLQLGFTDKWYIDRTKSLTDPYQARREYLLEWFNSNGNSPFDPDDIDTIKQLKDAREAISSPQIIKLKKYFDLVIYDEYHGRKPVIIGVDVSTGRGRDYSAITVVHPDTLMPLAFFRSNQISSNKLRKIIVEIGTHIYPNSIITIESNSVGTPLIQELRDTPVARKLYKERKLRTIDAGVNSAARKRTVNEMSYGHTVTKESRSQMHEMLETIVHYSPAHLAFHELYEEVRFMELKNGRIDHSAATHDDITMSYLGALWVIRYGKGLKGKGIYYNIRESEDDIDEGFNDNKDMYEKAAYILRRKKTASDVDEDEAELAAYADYLSTSKPVETSATWAERERLAYYKALDRRDGVEDEEDEEYEFEPIDKSTERLIAGNYNALMNSDLYGENDPIASLIGSSYFSDDNNDDRVTFSDLRNW